MLLPTINQKMRNDDVNWQRTSKRSAVYCFKMLHIHNLITYSSVI